MKDKVFHLPELMAGATPPDASFYFYTAAHSSVKNKVSFSQNMVCLLLQGTKEVFNASKHHRINNAQLLLLSAGSVLMSESMTDNKRFESILLFFSNRFVVDFIARHGISLTGNKNTPTPVLILSKDNFIINFENSLRLLQPLHSKELQQLKTEELLLYLLKQYPQQVQAFLQTALSNNSDTKLRQVVAEHLDQGLTVEELAFLCNMSASTFKRHFTETFHISPKRYFTAYKMNQAKQLLLMQKRASDIYAELGYESLSSFSSEFKKYFGISPKQFRDENDPKAKTFKLIA